MNNNKEKLINSFVRSIFMDFEEMIPDLEDRLFDSEFINKSHESYDEFGTNGSYMIMIDRIIKVLTETKQCISVFGEQTAHKCIQKRLSYTEDKYETEPHTYLNKLKLDRYHDMISHIFPIKDYEWAVKSSIWNILRKARDNFNLDDELIKLLKEKYPENISLIDELKDKY